MTQNEMIKNIAEKCSVTLEEARVALEQGEWNALTAAQLLENDKVRRMQEVEAVASGCAAATAQAPAEEPATDGKAETEAEVEFIKAAATAQAPADEPAADGPAATEEAVEFVEAAEEAKTAGKTGRTERAGARGRNCGQGLRKLGEHIRRLVACGNRNRFVVRRNDATLLELPVTVATLLMLFAFWTCVPLLVIGLFLGCRYSFKGQDFEKAAAYMKKAAEA